MVPSPTTSALLGKRLLLHKDEYDQSHPPSRSPNPKRMCAEVTSAFTLCALPDDIVCGITSFLDAKSLVTIRLLSRSFRTLASQGSSGWENLCRQLWKTKVHVPPAAISHPDRMAGYRMSLEDARDRDHVTAEELMYNPETKQGTIWSFRFKESAGPDWTSWDPWYNGNPCRKMVFLEDGTVKEYCVETQQPLLGHPHFPRAQEAGATGVLVDPPMSMAWRFLTRPLDLPARPNGSYIRFAVGGRDVPTYCVRRSPTKNWGFIMESCWGVYASFELPKRPSPRRTRRRVRRAQDPAGNWFNIEVDDDYSSDGEAESNAAEGNGLLVDDSSFSITSGLQWREAFLYNFGARVLPEGDDAVADFDRTYGTALHA